MALEWMTLRKFEKKKLLSTFLFFLFLLEYQTLNAFFSKPRFQNTFTRNISKTAELIYLKFGRFNLHKERQSLMRIFFRVFIFLFS